METIYLIRDLLGIWFTDILYFSASYLIYVTYIMIICGIVSYGSKTRYKKEKQVEAPFPWHGTEVI